MPTPPDFPADDVIVKKLSDRELLRNYCTFAGMHRAIVADILFRNLNQEPDRRRSIALEITANFVAALEDVALWFFVLREWKPGVKRLFDLLDSIQVTERQESKYSTQGALDELSSWTNDDMRRKFGLPSSQQLFSQGWTQDMVDRHIGALTEALDRVKWALQLRIDDQSVIVSSYNKIKHGALAVADSECSSIGISIMIPSRRGPKDPAIGGKRKINFGWIPCEDEAISKLVRGTLLICEGLWVILCLVYQSRFDHAWNPPEWPITEPQ